MKAARVGADKGLGVPDTKCQSRASTCGCHQLETPKKGVAVIENLPTKTCDKAPLGHGSVSAWYMEICGAGLDHAGVRC